MTENRPLVRVYVGLGSNRGDRLQFLSQALGELEGLDDCRVDACSSVYETEPVGRKDQPDFLNMVVCLETPASPAELYRNLKAIEQRVGRTDSVRWGPREIDLDLLYYSSRVVRDKDLEIPHPETMNRRFVLVPLNEIAADFIDPVRMMNVRELLAACPDTSSVRKTNLRLTSTSAVKVR